MKMLYKEEALQWLTQAKDELIQGGAEAEKTGEMSDQDSNSDTLLYV